MNPKEHARVAAARLVPARRLVAALQRAHRPPPARGASAQSGPSAALLPGRRARSPPVRDPEACSPKDRARVVRTAARRETPARLDRLRRRPRHPDAFRSACRSVRWGTFHFRISDREMDRWTCLSIAAELMMISPDRGSATHDEWTPPFEFLVRRASPIHFTGKRQTPLEHGTSLQHSLLSVQS